MATPFRLALPLALLLSALPLLASAQTYEYQRSVLGLRVSGAGTGTDSQPGTPPTVPANAQTSTSLVDFGSVATHTTEKRQVVLTNTGGSGLGFTAAPAVLGDLAFGTDLTTCGESLAAGQSCLTDVLFAPTAVGSMSGNLRFSTSLTGAPADVVLQGQGYNPVSLASATLPDGMLGKPYSYDFKQLLAVSNEASPDKALATWQGSGTLPTGLSFNTGTGVLSGTPSTLNPGAAYTVTGTYKNNQGQQVYTIKVGEAVLEVVQISAGGQTTCAVTTAGAAKCWGYNLYGQLGNGTNVSSYTPVQVTGLSTGVVSIAASWYHACAVVNSGAVKCWGHNNQGQLGNGTVTGSYVPVQVTGLTSGVSSIAVGSFFNCATVNGGLKCWGQNSSGQLGNGTGVNSNVPVQVTGLTSGVSSVAAGESHICAVMGGSALCWGNNGNGQLGTGTTLNANIPVQVSNLASNVNSVSAGTYYSCAVTTSGGMQCWGANNAGQLGNGSTTIAKVPVQVSGLSSGVSQVSAGNGHTCAVAAAGAVKCWGSNSSGQLGDGTRNNSAVPVQVSGLISGVASISAGGEHTCATMTSGAAKCWGNNVAGQLGDNSATNRLIPVNVKPGT